MYANNFFYLEGGCRDGQEAGHEHRLHEPPRGRRTCASQAGTYTESLSVTAPLFQNRTARW